MNEGLTKVWGELWLYQDFANRWMSGEAPYRDFFPEYPPFALPYFFLANLFGEQYFTLMWYAIILLFLLGIFVIIKKLDGKPWLFLASILPLGGLLFDRFDVIPAFWTIFMVYQLTQKRFFRSYLALAIGVLTKIYPIVFFPVIFIGTLLLGFSLKKAVGYLILFGFLISLPFMMIWWSGGQEGIKKFVEFQGKRGIQIESTTAMPYLMSKDTIVEYKHNTFEVRK